MLTPTLGRCSRALRLGPRAVLSCTAPSSSPLDGDGIVLLTSPPPLDQNQLAPKLALEGTVAEGAQGPPMSPEMLVSRSTESMPGDAQQFLIWPHASGGFDLVPASHQVSPVMVQLSDLREQRL